MTIINVRSVSHNSSDVHNLTTSMKGCSWTQNVSLILHVVAQSCESHNIDSFGSIGKSLFAWS